MKKKKEKKIRKKLPEDLLAELQSMSRGLVLEWKYVKTVQTSFFGGNCRKRGEHM